MITIVLAFIGTYFIELLYRRFILCKLIKRGIKEFDANKDALMKIDLKTYNLGSSHLYK